MMFSIFTVSVKEDQNYVVIFDQLNESRRSRGLKYNGKMN